MNNDTSAIGPVVLAPLLVERIWGTASLDPWHPNGTQGKRIGEIWLTAENCVVESGTSVGNTLAQLTAAHPEAFGDPQQQGFPLLIKLLFPHEKLSVQVHPDDAQAKAAGLPRGKTECWYVLEAEPGAQLALGFKEPLTPDQIAAAIADGSIESKLRTLSVQAGDMAFVDAGTVHAIGPGMVILETQQYSDTTYRLWDYGRPRELHVEAGTAATRPHTQAGLVAPEPMDGFTRLISCEYFIVDRFPLDHGNAVPLSHSHSLQILIALESGCAVLSEDDEAVQLPYGQAVILPATGQKYQLIGENRNATVIRILQP